MCRKVKWCSPSRCLRRENLIRRLWRWLWCSANRLTDFRDAYLTYEVPESVCLLQCAGSMMLWKLAAISFSLTLTPLCSCFPSIELSKPFDLFRVSKVLEFCCVRSADGPGLCTASRSLYCLSRALWSTTGKRLRVRDEFDAARGESERAVREGEHHHTRITLALLDGMVSL